jgi:serine/threonine protein phosphatase PrpC
MEDAFDFDYIVELFKRYVYNVGNDLRNKASQIDPSVFTRGYRYDIALHKSSHHFKMENNHAIIEDLNALAQLPSNAPQSSFYGVYDGHGGYLISEYLSLHLAAHIAKHPLFQKNIMEAIRQSYLKTDDDVLRKINRDASDPLQSSIMIKYLMCMSV